MRIRPFLAGEAAASGDEAWTFEGEQTIKEFGRKPYLFDWVFSPQHSTKDLYDAVAAPIVRSCLTGINGTIFAYGQTASGKTWTMMGSPESPGLIPRAIQQIFAHIAATTDRIFLLRVSYMEIYNEAVNDLLAAEGSVACDLTIREVDGQFQVPTLRECIVRSAVDVMRVIQLGQTNRAVGKSNLNEYSSRSHTIFRMIIETTARMDSSPAGLSGAPVAAASTPGVAGPAAGKRTRLAGGAVNISELNLVDLAGSETLTEKFGTTQQAETKHINLSLTQLKSVIQALSQGEAFVPYRNSSLTKILRNSLGGNARTAVVCTGSPAAEHAKQTKSTLVFGSMAKTIVNRAVINATFDEDKAMMKQYQAQIQQMSQQLKALEDVREQKRKLQADYVRLQQEVESLRVAEGSRKAMSATLEGMSLVTAGADAAAAEAADSPAVSEAQLASLMTELVGVRQENVVLHRHLEQQVRENRSKDAALAEAQRQLQAFSANGVMDRDGLLHWLDSLIAQYEQQTRLLEDKLNEQLSIACVAEMDARDAYAALQRKYDAVVQENALLSRAMADSVAERRMERESLLAELDRLRKASDEARP